ncbi:6-bladed beta-propeller [Rhodohalobacter mucosus]|uniref:6-bladed beta-propeller n=1 Tax=Rhodohalobacter mucosus TaxID=2079485 RepID=UPI001304BA71|nr:6-bladed beta-propeller [Rhodohalobacter mucosus]
MANTQLKYLTHAALIQLLLISIIISACSGSENVELPERTASLENVSVLDPNAEPEYLIKFEEIYSVGNREPVLFSRISEVEADDRGYLYAAESFSGQETVYVFDREGTPVTTLGRNGAGPGEFRSIFSLSHGAGFIYVLDYNLQRFQGFSTESFEPVVISDLTSSQWDISGENTAVFPHRIEAYGDDSLLGIFNYLTFETDKLLLYRIDQSGSVSSERLADLDYIRHLRDPVESGRAYYDPFGGRGLISVSDDGRIFYNWSEDFLIRVMDRDGNDLYAFYYPVEKAQLESTEALNFYGTGPSVESFQRTIRSDGIPDYWRAIEHMVVDGENRIWVSVITDDPETYDWWVMDDRGQPLSKFTWPRSRVVQEVKNGTLYTIETDEETGVQEVVAYRISLES